MAALEGMINGVMATAGDYVEFSTDNRNKLKKINASATNDGTDVTIITSGHTTYAQSGVTL